jgi:serine/threonine-protein kinase HipA
VSEQALAVWIKGRRVGSLIPLSRRGIQYIPIAGAPVLSVGAPAAGPWSPEFTRAWFEGLLPEGDNRAFVEAQFSVQSGDIFGLLREIGWECAGAVAVIPEGHTPAEGRYDPLSMSAVWDRLDALPAHPYDENHEIRTSLGGAQSKLTLARRGGVWYEPKQGAPSTHILKPEPARWPGLAVSEAWALRASSAVTETASAELAIAPGHRPTLVVARFDRRVDQRTGQITRTHQEDLCQALGLPPGSKYATLKPKPFSPSLARLAGILSGRSPQPADDLRRLLQQVVISVGLGNTDAHSKNFSILHLGNGLVRLSPLYDVVPTLAFTKETFLMSLSVAGRFRIDKIGREQLVSEATSWGMSARLAAAIVDETLVALKKGILVADALYPAVPATVRQAVTRQMFSIESL